jgi:DNA processing protein
MSKQHWLALMSVPGIGGVTARKLLERFGSVEAILAAPAEELTKVARVTDQMAEQMAAISLDQMSETLEALTEAGIDVLTWGDDDYPANLRSVNDGPPLLFVRGTVLSADTNAVAIVGSREPSAQSEELAERLACELAERGLTIVSGLALGIDAAAHRGALRLRRGRTLGVLGSGLAKMFPPNNAELAEQIVERGAVLTELRPNVPATGPSLMARDRIVSGLSRAVIVVEAQAQSGSMDTARRARAQERLLIAVPGSPGCDLLLLNGAVRLDRCSIDLDALAGRIRAYPVGGDESQQLGLFG